MTSVPIESSSKYTHMPMAQISFVSQPASTLGQGSCFTVVLPCPIVYTTAPKAVVSDSVVETIFVDHQPLENSSVQDHTLPEEPLPLADSQSASSQLQPLESSPMESSELSDSSFESSLPTPVLPEHSAPESPNLPVIDDRLLILLAEDNEANIQTFSRYLTHHGFRVVTALNGQEAIDRAEQEKPHCILMDMQMPIMDGFQAMQALRCNSKFDDVPIIALTALAMAGDREKCLEAGANDYLEKPVYLKAIVETIERLLSLTPCINTHV
jgi:CheY-like chemotaxis protein